MPPQAHAIARNTLDPERYVSGSSDLLEDLQYLVHDRKLHGHLPDGSSSQSGPVTVRCFELNVRSHEDFGRKNALVLSSSFFVLSSSFLVLTSSPLRARRSCRRGPRPIRDYPDRSGSTHLSNDLSLALPARGRLGYARASRLGLSALPEHASVRWASLCLRPNSPQCRCQCRPAAETQRDRMVLAVLAPAGPSPLARSLLR